MSKEELVEMLNGAVARELTVSIQYMWQHVVAKGLQSEPVRQAIRGISIVEMRHAEAIAERVDYLGGTPTTKPREIRIGESLTQMIELDLEAEREAIEFYQQIIDKAAADGDAVTRRLFEEILAQEEEHEATFSSLLA